MSGRQTSTGWCGNMAAVANSDQVSDLAARMREQEVARRRRPEDHGTWEVQQPRPFNVIQHQQQLHLSQQHHQPQRHHLPRQQQQHLLQQQLPLALQQMPQQQQQQLQPGSAADVVTCADCARYQSHLLTTGDAPTICPTCHRILRASSSSLAHGGYRGTSRRTREDQEVASASACAPQHQQPHHRSLEPRRQPSQQWQSPQQQHRHFPPSAQQLQQLQQETPMHLHRGSFPAADTPMDVVSSHSDNASQSPGAGPSSPAAMQPQLDRGYNLEALREGSPVSFHSNSAYSCDDSEASTVTVKPKMYLARSGRGTDDTMSCVSNISGYSMTSSNSYRLPPTPASGIHPPRIGGRPSSQVPPLDTSDAASHLTGGGDKRATAAYCDTTSYDGGDAQAGYSEEVKQARQDWEERQSLRDDRLPKGPRLPKPTPSPQQLVERIEYGLLKAIRTGKATPGVDFSFEEYAHHSVFTDPIFGQPLDFKSFPPFTQAPSVLVQQAAPLLPHHVLQDAAAADALYHADSSDIASIRDESLSESPIALDSDRMSGLGESPHIIADWNNAADGDDERSMSGVGVPLMQCPLPAADNSTSNLPRLDGLNLPPRVDDSQAAATGVTSLRERSSSSSCAVDMKPSVVEAAAAAAMGGNIASASAISRSSTNLSSVSQDSGFMSSEACLMELCMSTVAHEKDARRDMEYILGKARKDVPDFEGLSLDDKLKQVRMDYKKYKADMQRLKLFSSKIKGKTVGPPAKDTLIDFTLQPRNLSFNEHFMEPRASTEVGAQTTVHGSAPPFRQGTSAEAVPTISQPLSPAATGGRTHAVASRTSSGGGSAGGKSQSRTNTGSRRATRERTEARRADTVSVSSCEGPIMPVLMVGHFRRGEKKPIRVTKARLPKHQMTLGEIAAMLCCEAGCTYTFKMPTSEFQELTDFSIVLPVVKGAISGRIVHPAN
ncbi:uncharacterized protein LOC135824933 [Sycon ciliatum]|uniref:uncharacterized protein LOC135824933 n=1 Tax=Sycon ciliatum TaxID=27933 RepID=UPI0031F6C6BA